MTVKLLLKQVRKQMREMSNRIQFPIPTCLCESHKQPTYVHVSEEASCKDRGGKGARTRHRAFLDSPTTVVLSRWVKIHVCRAVVHDRDAYMPSLIKRNTKKEKYGKWYWGKSKIPKGGGFCLFELPVTAKRVKHELHMIAFTIRTTMTLATILRSPTLAAPSTKWIEH